MSALGAGFDVETVHANLAGSRFSRLHFTPRTQSTNDDAALLLGTPGGGGTIIVTDFQEAGRGRRRRDWIAPPGSGLLFTSILPDAVAASSLWAVTFWAALCVADGIENATGLRVALVWPNDLLLDGGKCCGILCISRVTGDSAAVACGAGINVFRPAENAGLEAIVPAPAFLDDRAPDVARETLLATIARAYESHLPLLDDPASVARLWEARAGLDGTPYTIAVDGASPVRAIARSIAGDGSLLADVDGRTRRFTLADARIAR